MLLFSGLAILNLHTPNTESKGQLVANAMWEEVMSMAVDCCCFPGHVYQLAVGGLQ